ncbi:UNVERIFIED_CONTAM: multidrug MFS transporter [Mumia flava]
MTDAETRSPWPALWALVIGFFMILVDTTIVTVAMPAIMESFDADVSTVVWVTSAYLLAYAVPLLVTGRLGDRVGPKRVYLTGLALFTAASLWCGLTGTIEMLIAARVVQGLGASMMTPQTMSVITRTFPADQRGRAMSLWGAVSGVAMLVGPIAGGLLVDGLGWEWIFFVNVPVGIVGFVLAMRLVPALPTLSHRFDLLGVALSAVGMFLLVFGIQEGETYEWGTITGFVTVWGLIATGVVVLGIFVVWQRVNRAEPLVPLSLFRDRNFSLSAVAIATIGFGITAMSFPVMLWAQVARGYTPTQAGMLLIPMAVLASVLAPWVGGLADRMHPRILSGIGIGSFIVALVWLGMTLSADVPVWQILLPISLLGVANGFMWGPTTSTATRNLPMDKAGAGSGIYNTMRQVGAVFGSAAIAAIMTARLAVEVPGSGDVSPAEMGSAGGSLPAQAVEGFSSAMGQSLLLPAAVLVIGLVAVLCYARPTQLRPGRRREVATAPAAAAD